RWSADRNETTDEMVKAVASITARCLFLVDDRTKPSMEEVSRRLTNEMGMTQVGPRDEERSREGGVGREEAAKARTMLAVFARNPKVPVLTFPTTPGKHPR